MKQCSHGIDGLRSDLSPSKSEHEDSLWVDYTLDLSFLSSDDSLPNLSRDVDTTKAGQILEDNIVSKLPELLIESSTVADFEKRLELSSANASVMSEKSSTESVQDDSDEDFPCWIGINSRKTLASGAKSMTCRRSTDDLSGFHRLNPLAPQFVPSSSKKNVDTVGKKFEETTSSSLKKSLSSDFPSLSGEFNLTDPLEDGRDNAGRRTSFLTHSADENLGFVSQDSVLTIWDSRREFQPLKKLDPLAPVFVPSSAKPSPSVHEANAHSTSALAYSDNKSLGTVKVDISSGEVGRIQRSGSTSSYNPWFESNVVVTESAKLGSSSNKSQGQRRLNPLARQFSLADTKPRAYCFDNFQAADDLSLVVNTTGLSPLTGCTKHNVVNADKTQSPLYVERFLSNTSHGSSSLISPKIESNFGSSKLYAVKPNTTLSVNGSRDFRHPLPFHVVDTAASSSSSDVKPLSGPSPKVDMKKLLTTIHGLSELLTLAHGSESSGSPDADEIDLINSTVQNLNLYIGNNTQEQAGHRSVSLHNSFDLKLMPSKSKVVAKSGYQQNHLREEQIIQRALFYKSLWLKAEADRCLMVYETSLLNPDS